LFNNKLTVIDPETLESRTLADTSRFDLGMDGNLYLTDMQTNTILYRIEVDGDIREPFPNVPLAVNNAGFESPTSGATIPGWSPFFAPGAGYSYEVSGARSRTGGFSLKTTDATRTGSVAVIGDKIPVTPGEEYEAGAHLFIESGQPGLMFRYFDAKNNTVSTLETHLDESRLSQWQRVSLRGKAPANAAYGRFLAVTSRYNIATAYYDDFYVTVKDRVPPSSTATVTPAPNANGWNNSDATVSIVSDRAYSLTYSAEGAQPTAETTARGDAVQVNVTQEGKTTISYSATNASGVAESPKTLDVFVDKTAPVIQFVGAPTVSVSQDVYLRCTASDALSGLAGDSCADALVERPAYELEPGIHSVEATAEDAAGNVAILVFTFEVTVGYDDLAALVARFVSNEEGIATALTAKLRSAQEAEARGDANAEAGSLRAFENQLEAHSGKKIDEAHASLLLKLAGYL
jgi:hypothetical protein